MGLFVGYAVDRAVEYEVAVAWLKSNDVDVAHRGGTLRNTEEGFLPSADVERMEVGQYTSTPATSKLLCVVVQEFELLCDFHIRLCNDQYVRATFISTQA